MLISPSGMDCVVAFRYYKLTLLLYSLSFFTCGDEVEDFHFLEVLSNRLILFDNLSLCVRKKPSFFSA